MAAVVGHSQPVLTRAATTSRALTVLPAVVLFADAFVVSMVTVLASAIGDGMPFFDPDVTVDITNRVAGPAIAVGWIVMIALGGGYRQQVLGGGSDEYKRVLNASLVSTGVLALGLFLTQAGLSRGFFVALFAIGLPSLLMSRWSVRRGLHLLRLRGHLEVPVLVAGSPRHVDEISVVLSRAPWLGYKVVGALTPDATDATGGQVTPGGTPSSAPPATPPPPPCAPTPS